MEKFLIGELAERAGTTIRTIRYYTDEGLLPQPEIQGRYAYYGLNHLNRLELIRRMKAAYLPLRDIQQVMLSMSDAEVQNRLAEGLSSDQNTGPKSSPPPAAASLGSEAVDYISLLLKDQQKLRPQSPPAPMRAPAPSVAEIRPGYVPSIARDEPFIGEHWQRISLAPGIELHLRNPVNPDTARRVQQLIAFANKLFRQN